MNPLKCSRVARLYGPLLLTVALAPACGSWSDDLLCEAPNCEFTSAEWSRVQSLANLGDPPADPSNRLTDPTNAKNVDDLGRPVDFPALNAAAVDLGWKLYYDPYFAGPATWVDALGRVVPSARAARCAPATSPPPNTQRPGSCPDGVLTCPGVCDRQPVSCASCHDPAMAGSDYTSRPGHVSEGSAWYDVNIQQTLNVAHYKIFYWNGRSDSVWAQANAVIESDVSMNGNRMEIVRRLAERYRAEYTKAFPNAADALPDFPPRASLEALLVGSVAGECAGEVAGACSELCEARLPDPAKCWPKLPLRGKGGRFVGCQAGDPNYREAYDDAFDCAPQATRDKINRIFANFGKSIAAYEHLLSSQNAPFDQYVSGKHEAMTASAVRGLKLFVGKASCIDCHNTKLLSDSAFHNIGVPQAGLLVPTEEQCTLDRCNCDPTIPAVKPPRGAPPPPATGIAGWPAASCLPWGFTTGLARLHSKGFRRDGPFSDDPNLGAAYVEPYYKYADDPTNAPPEAFRGTWRTPSLRDVAKTAPYMHDGVYRTLDDVIWHYDQGGTATTLTSKAPELRPLRLTNQERLDLVEFLKTLTGTPAPGREVFHRPPPDFAPTP
jgi:cytochrome c peroxidase